MSYLGPQLLVPALSVLGSQAISGPKTKCVPAWCRADIGITTGHAIFYLVNREEISIHLFSNFQPQNLCDIQTVSKISVSRDDEVHRKVDITLKDPDKEVS